MALPGPGAAISLNQVNVELGYSGTAQISMNDAAVRTMFAKPSGAISMSDGFSKEATITSVTVSIQPGQPFFEASLTGCPGAPGTGEGFAIPGASQPVSKNMTVSLAGVGANYPSTNATRVNWSVSQSCPGPGPSWTTTVGTVTSATASINLGTFSPTSATAITVTAAAPAAAGSTSGSKIVRLTCLPLDTLVTMGDGTTRELKDIKKGDVVKTMDPVTNKISSNKVTHLLKRHVASELIHIELENGIMFRATPEHDCWIRRDDAGMWVTTELIQMGDFMLTEGIEYQKVINVERVEYEEGIEVSNISVAEAHVYFANKILLHNSSGL